MIGTWIGLNAFFEMGESRGGRYCEYTETPGKAHLSFSGRPSRIRFDRLWHDFGSLSVTTLLVLHAPAYVFFAVRRRRRGRERK